ncbi:hypothetical protein [Nocardia abscessus]|uniref:hypothetical protein n=1 Tax=Nocardia abscessus TaxID=120957 RepID=UPI002454536D|nr:hypothetical protein [Nocardia abscessus]
MSLADELAATSTTEPQHRPRIEFDGRSGYIDSEQHPASEEPVPFSDLLEKHGLTGVRLDPNRPVRIARWQNFHKEWLQSDRFYIVADTGDPEPGERLIQQIIDRAAAPRPVPAVGSAVFNFQASDLQIGKVDNGGTEKIVDRFMTALERAVRTYQQARTLRPLGTVHLMFPGDCVEGNQSQSGRNMWRTDLTITEQVSVFEHLLYASIDAFADITDEVLVDVVNGNHDEAQRFQTTRPGDGWATHAANSVARGLLRNPDAYEHVTIRTPDPERAAMTVPAGDTVFTVAHGHQWRRGKAMDWWQGQAFHGQGPGGADILVHGHYHTFEVETTATRTRIQSSTLDGGSNYYRDRHGAESRRGALIYVTKAGDISDLSLV